MDGFWGTPIPVHSAPALSRSGWAHSVSSQRVVLARVVGLQLVSGALRELAQGLLIGFSGSGLGLGFILSLSWLRLSRRLAGRIGHPLVDAEAEARIHDYDY